MPARYSPTRSFRAAPIEEAEQAILVDISLGLIRVTNRAGSHEASAILDRDETLSLSLALLDAASYLPAKQEDR
jgi:hypothetical protein